MKLTDLTVAFLGDSITEGYGASSPESSFPSVFEKNTDIKKALNYGVSGTRIATQKKTYMNHKEWDQTFISRVGGMSDSADVIVVCCGINDYVHGDAPLGAFDDRGEYTFYGAMHLLIRALLEKFPQKHVFFMTPVHFVMEKGPEYAYINKGYYFSEYLSAIKEVCEYYSIPIFDLYSIPGMNPAIEEEKKTFYSDDTHPNDEGYARIAALLADFMRNF